MIKTRSDLKRYQKADREASNRPKGGFINWLFYSETYYIQTYLDTLRKLEFLTNKKRNILDHLLYVVTFWKYKRMSFKLRITIPPNVAGPGLSIQHIGNIIINANARLGSKNVLQPGVVIGQKDSPENVPTIGDNVYFGPGCKVIGKIRVGNNAVIAPNSVVIKDVPDNAVVSGVPAVVIKMKTTVN
ncbi:MAG: hypothetical protein ABIS36_20680 [Chryseolinea sp.]